MTRWLGFKLFGSPQLGSWARQEPLSCSCAFQSCVPSRSMTAEPSAVHVSLDEANSNVVGGMGGFFCCFGKPKEEEIDAPPPDEDFHSNNIMRLPHGYTAYRLIEPSRPGSNPPHVIVMLHGLYGSSYMWADLAELLAEFDQGPRARILVYDFYGRGRSPWTGLPLSLDMYVTQLKELLDALRLSQQAVSIIGYDVGGAVAAGFAAKFPHLCASMVLLSPAGIRFNSPFQEVTLQQKYFGEIHIARKKKDLPDFQRSEFFKNGEEEEHSNMIHKQEDMVKWQIKHSPGYLGSLLSTFRNFPLRYMDELFAAVGRHPRRVLVMCGSNDTITSYKKCIQVLEESFPRADVVDVLDCGHNIIFEKFDEATTEILAFLRDVVSSIAN